MTEIPNEENMWCDSSQQRVPYIVIIYNFVAYESVYLLIFQWHQDKLLLTDTLASCQKSSQEGYFKVKIMILSELLIVKLMMTYLE